MTTTRTHAAPWTIRRFLADMSLKATRKSQPAVLTGREATARHLFGEACQWGKLDMLNYDRSPHLQRVLLAEADRRIAHAASPDRHVAAHWGYAAAEWIQLPAIVKVDKREGYFQAMGLGA